MGDRLRALADGDAPTEVPGIVGDSLRPPWAGPAVLTEHQRPPPGSSPTCWHHLHTSCVPQTSAQAARQGPQAKPPVLPVEAGASSGDQGIGSPSLWPPASQAPHGWSQSGVKSAGISSRNHRHPPCLHIPLPLRARVSCKVLSRSTSPASLSLLAVPPKLAVVPAASPVGVRVQQGRGCRGSVSCARPRAGCPGSPGSGGVTHRVLLCVPRRPAGAPAASATSGGAAERLQGPPEALPGVRGGPGQGG